MKYEIKLFFSEDVVDKALVNIVYNVDSVTIKNNLVEVGWESVLKYRDNLFVSNLLRVLDYDFSDGVLNFKVSDDVTYKDVVGLRKYPEFMKHVSLDDIYQVISCIMFVRTSCGSFVLVERDSGDWPHSVELSGGFVKSDHVSNDLFEFVKDRVAKDFSINENNIEKINFVGVIDFKSICEVMNVFLVDINITFEELENNGCLIHKLPLNYSPENHTELFSLPMHYPTSVVLDLLFKKIK